MQFRVMKRFLAMALSAAMILSSSATNVLASEIIEIAEPETVIEEIAAVGNVAIEAVEESESVLKEGAETYNIEINQGFSLYEKKDQKESENYSYQNDFVASKTTVVAIKVDGANDDAIKQKIANWELTYNEVVNGEEKSEPALTWKGNEFELETFYDENSNAVTDAKMAVVRMTTGPSKGTYTFHLKDNGNEIAKNEKVNFFETQTLNILAVPVISYYSAQTIEGTRQENQAPEAGTYDTSDTSKYPKWNGIDTTLKTYLKKVYPIADINIEVGQTLNLGEEKYDLSKGEGDSQRNFWEECNKLQVKDKDTGKDKYDLILAFVPYRQDEKATGQGYTFGKPTNIITLEDKDMLPTVAHEIAHCYKVGDEYDGGSYNARVNDMPLGYGKGRDKETGNDVESSDKHLAEQNVSTDDYHWLTSKQYGESAKRGENVADKPKSNVQPDGNGSVIDPRLHSYDLENKSFIKFAVDGEKTYPTISYMGSGYPGSDGYYYTTSVIWNHLFKELMVKEKNTESSEESNESSDQPEEQSNAEILLSSGEDSIKAASDEGFNIDDFYYDDNYREGASRMIEVSGVINYASSTQKAEIKSVEVEPMFSYDGDLSYMDFMEKDEEKLHNDYDLFYFMALDKDGKVISSPIDGQKAVFEFYGGNFNPNMSAPTKEELAKDAKDKRYQKFAAFNFDAEYPEDTEKFAIVRKADYKEDGTYTSNVLWSVTAPKQAIEGDVLYADVDSDKVQVDFSVTAYDEEGELNPEKEEDKKKIDDFYAKVYYAPLGDEGQTYFAGDGKLADFYSKDAGCYRTTFDPRQFGANNSDAYVWIMASDGVNGADMFSDDINVSVANATVAVSGGKKGTNKNGFPGLKVFNYSASEITPKVKVSIKDLESGKKLSLVEGRDYVLSYENNVNAGVGTVKVKGIGEYSGTTSSFFGIAMGSAKKAKIDNLPDLVYSVSTNKVNGKDKNVTETELESYLDVTVGNMDLTVNKDYYPLYVVKDGNRWPNASQAKKTISANFVEGKDYVDVRVYVKGKANYADVSKKYAQFRLYKPGSEIHYLPNEIAKPEDVELKKDEMTYTGKRVKAAVKKIILKDGSTLNKKYYKLIYTNNKNIGEATIKIVGKNGYTGTYKKTFKIVPAKVRKLTVSKIQNLYYTGSVISANDINVVVKAGKYTLKRDVDYTVSVNGVLDTPTTKEIKNAGNAPTVSITLKDNASRPIVVENAQFTKTFSILKGRYNSNALTSVVLDSVSGNGIDGLFSRNSEKKLFKSYAYVLDVGGKDIESIEDAKAILNMKVKVAGKNVSKDAYTVSITKTPAGKVGKIIITPTDTAKYSGKRIIKFLNCKE